MKLIIAEAKADDIVKFVRYNICDDGVIGRLFIPLDTRMPDELHLKLRNDDSRKDANDES